jgi:hypothetical protein
MRRRRFYGLTWLCSIYARPGPRPRVKGEKVFRAAWGGASYNDRPGEATHHPIGSRHPHPPPSASFSIIPSTTTATKCQGHAGRGVASGLIIQFVRGLRSAFVDRSE